MKKIKDFIYNTNDIIIAILILVIAAGIIWWRMGIILDYPKTLINNGEVAIDGTLTTPDDTKDENSSNVQMPEDQGGTDHENIDDSDSEENIDSDQTGALWTEGALSRDVSVTVKGNTATEAVNCLVQAGLFDDYNEFSKCCKNINLNPEMVRGGSFTFESGSTKEDIAKIIAWH